MKRIGEHAVVVGASMGGLLAVRALADFYGQVTVLERDAVADVPRKGVPQGKHARGLLARDIANDVNWIGHGVTIKSAPSDMVGLLAARPVLEGNVRRRLLALPNVRAIKHCAVQGLIADQSRTAICGVRVKADNGAEETKEQFSKYPNIRVELGDLGDQFWSILRRVSYAMSDAGVNEAEIEQYKDEMKSSDDPVRVSRR
jgi:2-polyprenyl-6-methoxyphenol hydroxylase-like FAD-dependent oxidoreductase